MGFDFDEQSVKRIVRSVLHSERQLQNPVPAGASASGSFNIQWFPVKNTYAGTIPAGGVVKLGDFHSVSGIHSGYREVTRPDTTFGTYAINSTVPIAENGTGQCAYFGAMSVRHDSSWTPVEGEWGGPKPSSFDLFQGYPALVRIEGPGENATHQLALGTLHPIGTLLCKATADNAAGTLATDTSDYKIQKGTAGSEADAGFTTQPAIYARTDVVNNEFFRAHFVNGTWYAECDEGSWLGKADALISAGSSGTISLWTGTPGSESDSTVNITARNRTSVDIPSAGWVHVLRVNGKIYCEPWSC